MRSLILAGFWMFSTAVLGDIYECVEPNGGKLFTSDPKEAKVKGCKAMNLGPANTVSTAKAVGKYSTPTPQGFPKVDKDTQKQRDNDRLKLLEQELASEEKLLAQARKDLAEQESIRLGSEFNYQRVLNRLEPYKKNVALHENNVANLKRELASVR